AEAGAGGRLFGRGHGRAGGVDGLLRRGGAALGGGGAKGAGIDEISLGGELAGARVESLGRGRGQGVRDVGAAEALSERRLGAGRRRRLGGGGGGERRGLRRRCGLRGRRSLGRAAAEGGGGRRLGQRPGHHGVEDGVGGQGLAAGLRRRIGVGRGEVGRPGLL